MCEECRVKPPCFAVEIRPDHEARPARPKNVDVCVILAFVRFAGVKDPAAAVGIAVAVDKAACGSGIFEFVGRVIAQNLWLAGTDVRIAFHKPIKGVDPAGAGSDIGVQQNRIAVVKPVDSLVVTAGKSVILVEQDTFDPGKLAREQFS